MGCAQSSLGKRRGTIYGRRNTLVAKPTVGITVGKGIKLDNSYKKVLFIFGGPGSGKGSIVNNLIEMYNFRFICGEDLILAKLSEKLLSKDTTAGTAATQELQKLILEDSSQLTLRWVLELISDEIAKYSTGETFLIDIVPNLKFLLRVPTFVKNCEKEMKEFEVMHPVMMAINLSLDQAHLISNINQTHACVKAPSSGQSDDKGGNSDEMDTSRTQRRFNIYENSVKEFLAYFESDEKVLTVDTSCGDSDAVWEGVRNFIAIESEIALPCRGLDQVVLLKMGDTDFDDIDHDRYPILDLNCKQFIDDYSTASPEKILKKITIQLKQHAVDWKTFLIDVSGTSLCSLEKFDKPGSRQLTFIELDIGQLDYFVHGLRRKTQRKKSLVRKQGQQYKSITTNENEALLFAKNTDTDLCHRIGVGFLNAK